MAYKDKEKQKEYQRKWMEKRRLELLSNKTCRDCGINTELTIVNAKSKGKKFSTSYTKAKLDEKINNSIILCSNCYVIFDINRKRGANTKHGHSTIKSRTYNTWRSMIDRCYNVSKDNYKWYGAKGVEVCERWHEFTNFLADMGERPEGLTLDRKDPRLNYEPNNCRWATASEQGKNKRKNYESV